MGCGQKKNLVCQLLSQCNLSSPFYAHQAAGGTSILFSSEGRVPPSLYSTLPPETVIGIEERESSSSLLPKMFIQAPQLTELAGSTTDQGGRTHPITVLVYHPFSPIEFTAFKANLPPYYQYPIAVSTLFETIFATYNPT